MKKSVSLIAIYFLIVCVALIEPGQVFAQTSLPKDSLSTKVLQGTAEIQLGLAVSVNQANSMLLHEPAIPPMHSQSALTGPGKVVMCVVVLSCLFFYFNRKK